MPKPFTFVGEVQTIADLPSDAEVGDVYQVIDPENDGEPNPILFAYEPTDDGNWLQINGLTDLSNYDTSKEVDDKDLALKNLLTAMIDSHTNEYALTKQVSSGKITTYGEGELGDFDLAAFHGSDNGSNYFTKTIGMSGQKITNMADGTDDTDAATVGQMKEYSVSITEAPTDGKLYGRQDSSWTEITGDFGSDSTPQMIQRSVSWTDTGVTIVYAFKGDTTSELYMCWSDMLYGTLTPVASSYIPEPSNQTMYIVSITNEYLTNTPAAGSAVSIYTTPTFDTGTRVWYETFHPQNTQIEESDPIAMAALENKSDIYYVAPESLKDIKVGDDVSNLYFIFDVAFKYADDLANPIQKVIEFSDGSYFEYEGSGTWDYIDSENKSHAIVDGGNYWTNGYIQIGDNVTITAIDPLFFDSPMSGGHLTDTSDIPSVSTPVDCEYNYNAIQAISKNLGTFVTTDYVDNSVAELESSVSDTYASKVYVDEQDGIIETDVASHKLTDRFRWSDVYLDTMLSFVRDGASIGLKLDNSATVEIDNPIAPVTNSDEQGGILSVVMRNTETADCTIVISGGETTTTYTSEGLNPNIPITKYFWIKNGETVNSINVEKYTYTPFIADPSSPISVMRSDISNLTNLVTKNANDILDIKAAIENLQVDNQNAVTIVDSENSIDITNNGTFTVNSTLGGRLNGEGVTTLGLLGLTVLATGIVSVNGETVYDNTALLGASVPPLVLDITDGSVIETSGMKSLIFSPYVAKT